MTYRISDANIMSLSQHLANEALHVGIPGANTSGVERMASLASTVSHITGSNAPRMVSIPSQSRQAGDMTTKLAKAAIGNGSSDVVSGCGTSLPRLSPCDLQAGLPTNVYRIFLDRAWQPQARNEMRETLRSIVDWYFRIEDAALALSPQQEDSLLRRWICALDATAETILHDGVRNLHDIVEQQRRSSPASQKKPRGMTPKLPVIQED